MPLPLKKVESLPLPLPASASTSLVSILMRGHPSFLSNISGLKSYGNDAFCMYHFAKKSVNQMIIIKISVVVGRLGQRRVIFPLSVRKNWNKNPHFVLFEFEINKILIYQTAIKADEMIMVLKIML